MGQGLSCREQEETGLFSAVQNGDLQIVEAMTDEDPNLLSLRTLHMTLSALDVAAANGQIEVLSMLLNRFGNPDILNRHKQEKMDNVIGVNKNYLAMKTDYGAATELISSELHELGSAVMNLANHAVKLGGLGFGTSFLKWIAAFAAMN